jgi:glucokinase
MKVVGVDLGGTKILGRVVDVESGKTTGREKMPTPRTGPDDVLSAVVDLVRALDGSDDAEAIGLGLPGLVKSDGVVDSCPNIVGWDSPVAVTATLSKRLGRPVVAANDVNCGVVAEHRVGAGRGVDDLMAVFVGTGVGAGLVLGGRLISGARGMAGELGHLTVVDHGRVCGCGHRGHLEAYAGRAGMEREARRLHASGRPNKLVELAGDRPARSRHLSDALAAGDEIAHELLDQAVMALAIGIGNAATLLDLSRVVLGGGVIDKLGQPFLDQISGSLSFGGFGPTVCDLAMAKRLEDAGVVGAALLAADRLR